MRTWHIGYQLMCPICRVDEGLVKLCASTAKSFPKLAKTYTVWVRSRE